MTLCNKCGAGIAPNESFCGRCGAELPHENTPARGNAAGKQFLLNDQEANIGRWDAEGGVFPDVDLDSCDPEAKVSRRHARISFQNGGYAIEDLGSTNGTFINRGHRLPPGSRHPLQRTCPDPVGCSR